LITAICGNFTGSRTGGSASRLATLLALTDDEC